MRNPLPPLVGITGPTASGKSGLALRLAEELRAEIVTADSRQVYK
ncbi:MAG: tRNA (adenosine(37)-N6)-dimethylallyltransferase MiaA, partial [Chloroflexota bacterium]|nr:tRNA (adenosine(37)-N6)-dimethylallyltransferase MiaA [Chloroflexota bacterium]